MNQTAEFAVGQFIGDSKLLGYQKVGANLGTGYVLSADRTHYWGNALLSTGLSTGASYIGASLHGQTEAWSRGFWGEGRASGAHWSGRLGNRESQANATFAMAIPDPLMRYTPFGLQDRALFNSLYLKWHFGDDSPVSFPVGVLGAHLYGPESFNDFRRQVNKMQPGEFAKINVLKHVHTFAFGESSLRLQGQIEISADGLTYSGELSVTGVSEKWNFEPHDPERGSALTYHWQERACDVTRWIGENITVGADFWVSFTGSVDYRLVGELTWRGRYNLSHPVWEAR